MAVKYLTFEERKQIEELLKKGAQFPQIAVLIGRSKTTIRNEVRKLGKRENYSAKKAQNLFEDAPLRRCESLKKWIAANKPKITPATLKKRQQKISQRLALVEQKVETLINLYKELKSGMH